MVIRRMFEPTGIPGGPAGRLAWPDVARVRTAGQGQAGGEHPDAELSNDADEVHSSPPRDNSAAHGGDPISSESEHCLPARRDSGSNIGVRYRTVLLALAVVFALGHLTGRFFPASSPPALPEPRVGALGTAFADPGHLPAEVELTEGESRDIEIFRNTAPSVVYISSLALRRDFFSLNVLEIPQGTGSGFVWDEDGHIVTNYHVISAGSRYTVVLADQSEWEATRVGVAPNKDLAVLKIDAPRRRLVPLALGSSADLMVGRRVLAIGNPFGLDQTLTDRRGERHRARAAKLSRTVAGSSVT